MFINGNLLVHAWYCRTISLTWCTLIELNKNYGAKFFLSIAMHCTILEAIQYVFNCFSRTPGNLTDSTTLTVDGNVCTIVLLNRRQTPNVTLICTNILSLRQYKFILCNLWCLLRFTPCIPSNQHDKLP